MGKDSDKKKKPQTCRAGGKKIKKRDATFQKTRVTHSQPSKKKRRKYNEGGCGRKSKL